MLKLFDLELSGNCYKVRLLLNFLGLEHELVPVNLLEGEHKQPAFLAKNPKGQVPVLADGDHYVSDSQAILVYLVEKAKAQNWYPTDVKTRAAIQTWLATAANEVARGPADARLVKLFGTDLDYERSLTIAANLLVLLEQHLSEHRWLAADSPTLADIAVFPYVALSSDAEISLDTFPHIRAWIERFKSLPGFISMPGIPVYQSI